MPGPTPSPTPGLRRRDTSNKPADTAVKQQRLPAIQPVMTPGKVILTVSILGTIFLGLGIVLYVFSRACFETVVRYDDQCPLGTTCTVDITIPNDLEPPVYLYYQLTGFHQNHRRYVKSRSDAQLRGDNITDPSSLSDCDPYVTYNGTNIPINPCGLIARSMFNDTLLLKKPDGSVMPVTKDGIAWNSDVESRYRSKPGLNQWTNVSDPDFIVWMRTASLPNFRKLYRIVRDPMPAGVYHVTIQSNFNVEAFGEKYVVLAKTTWFGGKNDFIGIAYIVVGGLCVLCGLVFGLKQAFCRRQPGSLHSVTGGHEESRTVTRADLAPSLAFTIPPTMPSQGVAR
ncbi:putative ALA-interacting subunit 1 [Paratrimastix pyriformis]|uniref:ALA-interacting subunit 1 n=1 Tax=Paratrimastix pyriformis TaxID=342808 RepID=A0ABQ8UKA3_9EUKA|nr:putative ALA-interacting subunit 1 [Paratrimastix pyriformis]